MSPSHSRPNAGKTPRPPHRSHGGYTQAAELDKIGSRQHNAMRLGCAIVTFLLVRSVHADATCAARDLFCS